MFLYYVIFCHDFLYFSTVFPYYTHAVPNQDPEKKKMIEATRVHTTYKPAARMSKRARMAHKCVTYIYICIYAVAVNKKTNRVL